MHLFQAQIVGELQFQSLTMAKSDLDHNHPLFLHPSDTTGAPIISIQLTGLENYSTWSRAMEIQLLGRNKLGLVDGTLKKEDFDKELGH